MRANIRHCPGCGEPLGSLSRHGRQRDCICALQARMRALEAGDREAFEGIIREINCQRPYRAVLIAARGLELLEQDTKGGEEGDHG